MLIQEFIPLAAAGIFSKIWPVIAMVLGIMVIITIHELGHFISAKLLGVQVNEFAIGFGPAILRFQKGETKYTLRAFPVGGFCAMEGEDQESDNPRAFGRKKVWRRMIIIASGAFCNILLGFVLVIGLLAPAGSFQTTTIVVREDGVAPSDLQTGDKIIKVNGRRIFTVSDLSYSLRTDSDGKMDLTVRRGEETLKFEDLRFKIVETGDEGATIDLGFGVKSVKNSFFVLLRESFLRTLSFARIVALSVVDMITGKVDFAQISGPVGMVSAGAKAASSGIPDLVGFLCIITINLGVFNLLPIPGLDGGRLLFLVVEGIRRKPIPPKYEGIIHAAGLLLLVALIIVITFKDIWQLIAG